MKKSRNLLILASVILCFAFQAQAETKKKSLKMPEKVDVQSLEKRYWAPKDKNFAVVQNRTYTKTKHVYLSLMPSLMLNEEYSKGFGADVSVGYFLNDRWGLELEYQAMSLEDNDLQKEVIKLQGFANHGKSTSYMGASVNWMPLYAKMSFLGRKIVYFDLSFGLNVGLMNYDQQHQTEKFNESQSSVAYGFHVSQSFYLTKKWVIRADYKHRFYNQEIVVGRDSQAGAGIKDGSFIEDRMEDSISLNLGLSYIF